MSQPTLNPIVAAFRSVEGPSRNMGPAPHADALARRFLGSGAYGLFENQVSLVEYLLPLIETPEEARDALEWMGARWPSAAAMKRNYTVGDAVLDEAIAKSKHILDTLVAKGADLASPMALSEPKNILDDTDLPLGELLVQLGHTHLSPLVPTPKNTKASKALALHCARNGDLAHCALWIKQCGIEKESITSDVWLALAREQTTPLEDLHKLPTPPTSWWIISHDATTYRHGQAMRARLIQDNPDLIPAYVQGAINAGALERVADEHLDIALSKKEGWTSNAGWMGSALEVALSDITGVLDGRRQSNFIKELIEDKWPSLLQRLGKRPSGSLSVEQWQQVLTMTQASGTKELVRAKPENKRMEPEALQEFLNLIPKNEQGAPDPSLAFLLALTTTSDKDIPTMSRTLPAIRSLADRDDMSIEQMHGRGLTVMGMMKLFTQRQNTVRMGTLDPEQSNIYLEHLLWRFLGSRLQQHTPESLGKSKPLAIMPAHRTLLDHIQTLVEEGNYPQWDRTTGRRMLHMLSHPLISMAPKVLSVLEYEALQETQQVSAQRPRSRL